MPGDDGVGFDNLEHRREVVARWGEPAWSSSQRWWDGLDPAGRADFRAESAALVRDWQSAAGSGVDVGDASVLDLVRRQADWIARAWGGRRPSAEELRGLGEMYVADDRFTQTYGDRAVAEFVRDAMVLHAASAAG